MNQEFDPMREWDAAMARAEAEADRLNRRDNWVLLVVLAALAVAIVLVK